MAQRFTVAALLILSAQLCGQTSKPVLDEQYAVYSAVLNEDDDEKEAARKSPILIRRDPEEDVSDPARCFDVPKGEAARFTSMFKAYVLANRKAPKLEPRFNLKRAYKLLSGRQVRQFQRGRQGKSAEEMLEVLETDGLGIRGLSAVGFSSDGTLALVYSTYWCGRLCAGGNYEILEKVNGEWKLRKDVLTKCGWIS